MSPAKPRSNKLGATWASAPRTAPRHFRFLAVCAIVQRSPGSSAAKSQKWISRSKSSIQPQSKGQSALSISLRAERDLDAHRQPAFERRAETEPELPRVKLLEPRAGIGQADPFGGRLVFRQAFAIIAHFQFQPLALPLGAQPDPAPRGARRHAVADGVLHHRMEKQNGHP